MNCEYGLVNLFFSQCHTTMKQGHFTNSEIDSLCKTEYENYVFKVGAKISSFLSQTNMFLRYHYWVLRVS